MILMPGIHGRLRIRSFLCSNVVLPGINPEFMMECKLIGTSDVINVLEEIVRN